MWKYKPDLIWHLRVIDAVPGIVERRRSLRGDHEKGNSGPIFMPLTTWPHRLEHKGGVAQGVVACSRQVQGYSVVAREKGGILCHSREWDRIQTELTYVISLTTGGYPIIWSYPFSQQNSQHGTTRTRWSTLGLKNKTRMSPLSLG